MRIEIEQRPSFLGHIYSIRTRRANAKLYMRDDTQTNQPRSKKHRNSGLQTNKQQTGQITTNNNCKPHVCVCVPYVGKVKDALQCESVTIATIIVCSLAIAKGTSFAPQSSHTSDHLKLGEIGYCDLFVCSCYSLLLMYKLYAALHQVCFVWILLRLVCDCMEPYTN